MTTVAQFALGNRSWLALLGCLLVTGCAGGRAQQLDRQLWTCPRVHSQPDDAYVVRCPDVLAIDIRDHPDFPSPQPVESDGRIRAGQAGRLRVDGLTIGEIRDVLAELVNVPREYIDVRVLEFNSQFVCVSGQVQGLQRVVAYQGKENVVEFLQRVGGITTGAACNNVRVIRPHVADNKPPEVYRVDLRAIVLHHDDRTNVSLQPGDRVHVGQTPRSRLECSIPPCLRTLYEAICGLRRDRQNSFHQTVPKKEKPERLAGRWYARRKGAGHADIEDQATRPTRGPVAQVSFDPSDEPR